jgi:hypothetical protein
MKLWLENRGYAKELDLENKYVEMIKPYGKDIFITWECKKEINDYFSHVININFGFVAVSEVEVQQGNYKLKLMKGTLEIGITAYVEYGSDWENLGFLNLIYKKLVAKSRLKECADDLYSKVYSFQKMIKEFIGLEA